MMREIKFRVWDHNTNTMMIPDYFEFYDGKIGWIEAGREAGPESGNDGCPDQFEIMQYTGLHDKNGRGIYEGDIVRVQETMDGGRIVCIEATAYVVWNDERGCWGCKGEFEGHLADYALGTKLNMMGNVCEVVGNIYENPELMEVAENE